MAVPAWYSVADDDAQERVRGQAGGQAVPRHGGQGSQPGRLGDDLLGRRQRDDPRGVMVHTRGLDRRAALW